MSISAYSTSPRFLSCVRGFLVTSTTDPVLHKKNERLRIKNQTGHWDTVQGRVHRGDALFLIIPSVNDRYGYPRILYGGVVTAARRVNERMVFSVDRFDQLETIHKDVRQFLNGKNPPQGNKVMQLWSERDRTLENISGQFDRELAKARQLSPEQLEENLPKPGTKPPKISISTIAYQRNAYVVAAALARAKGKCECCGRDGPFRRDDGSLFLEVHHIVRLADGGDDTLENAVAVCPNCHREMHHGEDRDTLTNRISNRPVRNAIALHTRIPA